MRHTLFLLLVPLAALTTACEQQCEPGFTLDGATCAFSEDAVALLLHDLDTSGLVRVNAEPFDPSMGSPIRRSVWVSPTPLPAELQDPQAEPPLRTAVDLYRLVDPEDDTLELPAAFPYGTLIVHEAVDQEEGHTVQVKLGDDVADVNGRGWWFGKFWEDGSPDLTDCLPCTACHNESARPTTEGLWGVPLEALD